jgi:hypothetical protein
MRNETERSGNSRVEGGEMPPPRAIISLSRVTNARGLQMQTAKMDDRESRDPSGGGDGPPTCVFQHFPPDLPLHFFLPFHSRAGILNGCRARSAPLGSARLGSARLSASRFVAGSSPPRGVEGGWRFRRRGEYRVSRPRSVAGAAANFVRPLRGYGGRHIVSACFAV